MSTIDLEIEIRKATKQDAAAIWEIMLFAIESRKKDGSRQWQDGYPNEQIIQNDIERRQGYVLTLKEEIVAYGAVIFEEEPAYTAIQGKWMTNGNYGVVHRLAVSQKGRGKKWGRLFMKKVEEICLNKQIFSIKIDTNFDNYAMLKILKQMGYTYCGEVYFRGESRKAFEKKITE